MVKRDVAVRCRWTGVSIKRFCDTSWGMKDFVIEAVRAGIVRCLSPDRTELCEAPATHVWWQDHAEWYPCCEDHRNSGRQWAGTTRWRPHDVELCVIPDLLTAWLDSLSVAERARIFVERYPRSDEEENGGD